MKPVRTATAIRLTGSAQRYADNQDLGSVLAAVPLGPTAAVGDTVRLRTGGADHEFVVAARCWIVVGSEVGFELTLDYPARRSAR